MNTPVLLIQLVEPDGVHILIIKVQHMAQIVRRAPTPTVNAVEMMEPHIIIAILVIMLMYHFLISRHQVLSTTVDMLDIMMYHHQHH
jgi:hypothetical protein